MEWLIFIMNLAHMWRGTLSSIRLAWENVWRSIFLVANWCKRAQLTMGSTLLMQTRLYKKGSWTQTWGRARKYCCSMVLASVLAQIPALTFFQSVTWKYKPNKPFLPLVAFCLVFMTASEGRLEYPPLFFLIVTLFTCGFCQTCYITVPYLFCQGVCFSALLIILTAQPWWIYSLLFSLANYCSISLPLHSSLLVA